MCVNMIKVAITTNGSGAFSKTVAVPSGALVQYRYVPDGTSPLDTGADLDITGSASGYVYVNHDDIGTSAFSRSPRAATHDTAGAASLYASGGEPVEDEMYVGESLTVAIASGGDTKSGTLYIWIAE